MLVLARFSSDAKACAHVVGAGMLLLLRMCCVSPSANELRELLSANHAARSSLLSITGTKDAARTTTTPSTPISSISEKAQRERLPTVSQLGQSHDLQEDGARMNLSDAVHSTATNLFSSQLIQAITFYDASLPDTPHQTDDRQVNRERDATHYKNQ